MANQIVKYNHPQFGELRVFVRDGQPWFVAKEVALALGYRDPANMTRMLDNDEKGTQIVSTLGGHQEMTVISESGLYHAVLKSRVEKACAFRRWVTKDVLPSIREHGMYATPQTVEAMLSDPDTMIETLQALKRERTLRLEAEAKVEVMAPKALFHDAVEGSVNAIGISELAKLLAQNGIAVGQKRLFELLREWGYLGSQGEFWNMPAQRYVEMGLFTLREFVFSDSKGELHTRITPKVTGKGQTYFVNLFLKKSNI